MFFSKGEYPLSHSQTAASCRASHWRRRCDCSHEQLPC
jgi:hypothetical protein